MERFNTFASIKDRAVEGRDFTVEVRHGTSGFAIMAPHGGGIEWGTDIIAGAIAGSNHGYYTFKGLLPRGNRGLHLTSLRFDEPRALPLIRKCHTIITVHGCRGEKPVVYAGGLDRALKDSIADTLVHRHFTVKKHPPAALKGVDPHNLCNRGLRGKGVQLELSFGLRRQLFDGSFRTGMFRNIRFMRFVEAMRRVLYDHRGTVVFGPMASGFHRGDDFL